ncbi:hypothetical protein FRC17_006609 [Serendipita sp. 399]|nr:hypothetical protein FRC17_006609 [Serendipita sp. 399]
MASNTLEGHLQRLRSLPTIRQRCTLVHELAQQGRLEYFEYHPEAEASVVDFCAEIMKRDYSNFAEIPPHGRWRHFDTGKERINPLLASWSSRTPPIPKEEQCARLLDLFLVSVLLDAGAGNAWKYKEQGDDGAYYSRSEGLAIASLDMFRNGLFSSNLNDKERVDAGGLGSLTVSEVATAMQVTPDNPMSGLDGRAGLLQKLGQALKSGPTYFGEEGRVGNLLHYLKGHVEEDSRRATATVHISKLWEAVMLGLAPIWPTDRTKLNGIPLGDVWRCEALKGKEVKKEGDTKSGWEAELLGLVPFHKLSQWLTYSLVEPIEKLMGWKFEGMEDMTGLPEYRNGGLLVDLGVLTLRPTVLSPDFYPDPSSKIPRIPASHPAIIEWRAMTVIELDRIADQLRTKTGTNLTLPQVLEAATWKGGREIARQLRGDINGGGPPIEIESDGTVF